ncbi:unnamed protein product [marine sediment metagenome]|uniref:Uncharacterized protein n=1 Tax=marine sediment metagenome TaxID=412755 RepID=X0VKX5_9ZZZZ
MASDMCKMDSYNFSIPAFISNCGFCVWPFGRSRFYIFYFVYELNYSLHPDITARGCYVRYLDDWFEYAAESTIIDGIGISGRRTSRQPLNNPARNTKMAGSGLLVE